MANILDQLFASGQAADLHTKAKIKPTLTFKEGVGILTFEALTMTTYELGKQIPAKSRWQGKELRFEASEAALAYVKNKWPDAIWLRPANERAVEPAQPRQDALPWEPRFPPFKHQADANAVAVRLPEFAYLFDMGTGKSKALIDDAAFQVAEGLIDRLLLIAPNEVHRQWVDEVIPDHWPTALTVDAQAKPETITKKHPFNLNCPLAPAGSLWFRSVNFESLWMEKLPPVRRPGETDAAYQRRCVSRPRRVLNAFGRELVGFLKQGRAMVAIDESHRIKNPGAQCTWSCDQLGDFALFRRILTGTPVGRDLSDYYAQFKFLNPRILGCDTMEGFKRQYCRLGGFNGTTITGYTNTGEFHQAIASVSWRVEKDDVLDLPPKLYGKRYVQLSPEQRDAYDELRRELILQLSDGTEITVAQAVQRILRLQQVTQGFLPRDDGTFERFPHHRIEALDELIQEMPDQAVIWCRFTQDIDQLLEFYGERAVRYDGQVPKGAPRKEALQRFQAKGGPDLFVGTPGAGGTGLDGLQGHASTVVYYSNGFNAIQRWQSEDRTHRIGTRGTVNYYDLIARGTMDAGILGNLKRKRDVASMSLAEIKSLVGA